jgi:hypothetical protein
MDPTTNKNIAHSYKLVNSNETPSRYKSIFVHNLLDEGSYASNSVKDYFISFDEFVDKSNDHEDIGKYIVFTATKPVINSKLSRSYITFSKLYKAYYEERQLENLTSLFYYKFQTVLKVEIFKEDTKITVVNPYKELARQITYPDEKESFSHLITITIPHTLETGIFEIMQWNRLFRKAINKGLRRLYQYVYKTVKDEAIEEEIVKFKRMHGDDKKKLKEMMPEIRRIASEKAKEYMNKNFRYFKVYETHKTGHLHVHFLMQLPPIIRRMKFEKIIEMFAKWFNTSEQGVDIKKIPKRDKKYAQKYVVKYLSKQFYNDSLTYTIDEDGRKYYLLKKNALIRNDVPRMVSKSRNVKSKRFKPGFNIKYEARTGAGRYKETYRVRQGLLMTEYDEVKEVIQEFKRRKASKDAQYQIERVIKRQEIVEKLNRFVDGGYRELIEKSKYMNIDEEFKEIAIAYYNMRHDRELRDEYNGLYHRANSLLYYVDRQLAEDPIDF